MVYIAGESVVATGVELREAFERGDTVLLEDSHGHRVELLLSGLEQASKDRSDGKVTFEKTTPRQMLDDLFGLAPERISPKDADDVKGVVALAINHGWDTPLYRADDLLGEGVYRAEPVDEMDALLAFAVHDGARIVAVSPNSVEEQSSGPRP